MVGPIAGTALDEFVRVYMLDVQIINGSPNYSVSLGIGFSLQHRREIDMGFLVTTLIFMVIGIIASLCTRICCNRGPSTNLFHLTLIITATVCCWMMWAIVYLAQMKPLIVPILSEGE